MPFEADAASCLPYPHVLPPLLPVRFETATYLPLPCWRPTSTASGAGIRS
jgi:hypothetical protein